MKNQINVNVTEGSQSQTISLIGEITSQEVIAKLLSLASDSPDEAAVVTNFLRRTGATISIETPDSSWVDRIQFNEVSGEIGFEASDGALITYPAKFSGFLDALDAPSAGKLQWQYRRGLK